MARLPSDVMETLLPHFEREYKELSANWAAIEKKAQLSGVVAGTLLSGVFALIGNQRFFLPQFFFLFFPAIAILLFVSAVFALRAIRISDETLPPPGEKLRDLAWKHLGIGNSDWVEDFKRECLHQQVIQWDQACKDLAKSTARKGHAVKLAHAWLLAAAAIALLFVLTSSVVLWRSAPS